MEASRWSRTCASVVVTALAGMAVATPAASAQLPAGGPPCTAPPPSSFTDRAAVDPVHRANVDCLAALGVTVGQPAGGEAAEFRPHELVTRGQMASFVTRALELAGRRLPPPSGGRFSDTAASVHRDAIDRLSAVGVVTGRTPTAYEPGGAVTRGQTASFLVRAVRWADRNPLADPAGAPFTDVAGDVHADAVATAAALGLVQGRTGTTFEPGAPTTRQEMATFVVRLLEGVRDAEAPAPVAPLARDVRQSTDFPLGGRPVAHLTDVRAAAQPGFDRVVLELANSEDLGWRVRPVEGPILASGSGREIEVRGATFLEVHLTPARTHDLSDPPQTRATYTGPDRVAVDGHVVTEVVFAGDFEANLRWIVGLRAPAAFATVVLGDPLRLVVDVAPAGG